MRTLVIAEAPCVEGHIVPGKLCSRRTYNVQSPAANYSMLEEVGLDARCVRKECPTQNRRHQFEFKVFRPEHGKSQ